ncbi:glycerophosphodiester phosphodiesterase [Epidermidibacterium keratini]|uniref:glycerophosphodiester phosphodiesterase n=1 Tax=Epidermidibacterium keratini TaxID=1891644 RepID=A0A7L4YNS4_9ACTN|nr:glycerophosphodiester phosphodiesterase [Epidermidibacterium keratini]QHC00915.1 glycerophosphodiester phosphodiesterase [Epidermidibacterium keratini]
MDSHQNITPRAGFGVATILIAVLLTAVQLAAPASAAPPAGKGKNETVQPLVIGHRGASGYRPEHTLASYELAARMGADYIEPDLVATKDGVLVARHENEISGTTDVAERPEFADRQTTKTIDGKPITGWFTEDFTLAELKTLRAKERLPQVRQENTVYDGKYEVPTFAEILELRASLSKELGREIGVYPETKHPTYFQSIGLPLEPALVSALKDAGLNKAKSPVFVQSFELTNLQQLRTELGLKTKTVFLTGASGAPYDLVAAGDPRTYADLLTADGLAAMSSFVDGIGPEKSQVIPRNPDGTLGTPTALVDTAHAAGLTVHPYTFRAENQFLPVDYRTGANPNDYGQIIEEMKAYLATGIDGLFTDQPDIGVVAVKEYVAGQ